MGTRGIVGFVIDGAEKLSYNHWDSYPYGLGLGTLHWLKTVLRVGPNGRIEIAPATVEAIRALRMVDESGTPTAEQWRKVEQFANLNVGGGVKPGELPDWYQALRECQGNLPATLAAGFALDSREFAKDSLFCEWGYIVDADAGNLDVYRGFQQAVPTDGRWAGIETPPPDHGRYHYFPIQRIWSLPFASLPAAQDEARWIEECEARAEQSEVTA